ncbi:MAG: hypothetical protein HY922_00955 [Elusimicrobia bacterium]|nr:hypothetical protein [Elusimicrobiota bacterium]
MPRTLALMTVAALLFTGGAARLPAEEPAAEQKPVSKFAALRSWFRHWKQGLEMERRDRKVRTTSAAVVRGNQKTGGNPDKASLRGTIANKKSAERMREHNELIAAVDLLLAGKLAAASAAFAAFEKAHPKSALMEDVQDAKKKLAEMKKEQPDAESPGEDEQGEDGGDKAEDASK